MWAIYHIQEPRFSIMSKQRKEVKYYIIISKRFFQRNKRKLRTKIKRGIDVSVDEGPIPPIEL